MINPTNPPSAYDSILKWWPFITFILGGLVAALWTTYGKRIRRFTWRAWHYPIAMAANNPVLGNLTVQHNGVNVNHIHATTVEFANASNRDVLDDLVTLSFQGVGHVIDTRGQVDATPIYFDPGYVAELQNASSAAEIQTLNSSIVYRIPVLNRRESAFIHMLLHRDDLSNPVVIASCNHPGFKLDQRSQPVYVVLGVSRNIAVYVGLIFTAPLLATLFWKSPHPYVNGAVAYLLGLAVAFFGALLVKAGKLVWRFFD